MLPIEAEEFLSWMATERGRSANTLVAYRRDLSGYTSWLAAHTMSLKDVDRSGLDVFVGGRRADGSAASSVSAQIAAVGISRRFPVEEGLRAAAPTADIEGVRVPAGIPHPLSEAEVTA